MGQNWAITIGINGYHNLQRLTYAQRDADAVQAFLQQELQIQTPYHFTDDSPAIAQDYGPPLNSYPTYATLRRFFRIRFEEPFLKPGDNLWFFFAGHGKRHEDRDYLMPIDADPGDEVEKSTWIPLSYITDRLRRSGADNVVMLIDACRSGAGRRDSDGFGREKQQGVITLFACSPWESSYEIDELQQGAFTHALLQSLQIEGEGNCATVERLYQRLRQMVPEVTQRYKRVQQTPYGVVEPPTKYHLILLPRKANLSDINTLKLDAQRAELNREFKLAKQLWIRVLAISGADYDAIEGIERLARVSATPVVPAEPEKPISVPQTGQRDATPSPPPPEPAKPAIPTFKFEMVTVDAQGREVNRRPGEAEYWAEELGNGVQLEMVSIPGGSFQMGSPDGEGVDDERPQHSVTVKPFLMGKYAVTQAQWKTVASFPKVERDLEPDPAHFQGDNRPVECVSWEDAIEFCTRLSQKTGREYRLPSEAEWEYACRAGTTTPFHFGETITTDLANYRRFFWDYKRKTYPGSYGVDPKGEFREQTTEVGNFPPNAFGLYDMHGNIWEWCLEHWHKNYSGAPIDGSAWIDEDLSLRLLRGGSWNDHLWNCRSAERGRRYPNRRLNSCGFRVVCGSAWTL
ncbi:SUMF1/EgtB/PvdO family nonheme iron enzyme [Egbenema bharatensis]|uniref:SUMF1/EgtB/PvdO family nonheme iron enzyme n=1 Tax=Egbenema bharatensis TaxID=3463334 RepID=UPI003A87F562